MPYLLLILFCIGSTPAFAEYLSSSSSAVDLSALTSEIKDVVPQLEGCDTFTGKVRCRRLTGDFTVSELAQINTTLAAHDPQIRQKQRVRQEEQRVQKSTRLTTKLGLTDEEFEALREAVR